MHKTHTSKDTKRNRMEALMRIQDGIKNLIVENQRRHAVNFCVQQHHYVVVYGHMMFDEESPSWHKSHWKDLTLEKLGTNRCNLSRLGSPRHRCVRAGDADETQAIGGVSWYNPPNSCPTPIVRPMHWSSHMIKGVRIKNPRSKGAGLRNKGYRITRLSHSGNRWCRFIGCSKMDSQTWLYQLLYPLEVHQTWLGLGNCWSKPVKSLEFSLLTYHTSRHKLLHIMLHSIPIESHGQPCIILVTAECPLKHET